MGDRRETAPPEGAQEKNLRIGILGGSFDPVHLGHVNLARDALVQADLDQILLVPARLQPFKQDRTPASGKDRMQMLDLALAEDARIRACDYELRQEGVSYTYLTLRGMREIFGPGAGIYFIVGTDSLLKLDTWMHAEELLTDYAYIVGSRPGYREEELDRCIRSLKERFGTEILRIRNRPFDISATRIQERIGAGELEEAGRSPGAELELREFIPDGVIEYIREHGLYQKRTEERRGGTGPAFG